MDPSLVAGLGDVLNMCASELTPEADGIDAEQIERARYSLLSAVRCVNKKYVTNWHHEQLADALDKVQRGEITRLMVFMPPRHGKSELVSRQFPAWCLGKNPSEKIIACSYSMNLAREMCRDVQRIMRTDEYQSIFSARLKSGVEANRKNNKLTEKGSEFELAGSDGRYLGSGIAGSITGMGFSLGIIDDYCKNRQEAQSEAWREKVWNWYTSTFDSRDEGGMSAGGTERIIVCATPWHEDDLAGRILAKAQEIGEEWVVIRFPAVKDDQEAGLFESTDHFADPREPGEPLWPKKFDKRRLERKRMLSSIEWSSLYMCRPSVAKGSIFSRDDWKRYSELPKGGKAYTFSLDCAFKDGENSSFVVLQLWCKIGVDHYLVDQWRDHLDYKRTKALCREKFKQYPQAFTKIIEEKANGAAIVNELKGSFSGIIPVCPKGSKAARAIAVQGVVESGNVWLPEGKPWVDVFIAEHTSFPRGRHDDQVDAMTQYLERSASSSLDFLRLITSNVA